MSSSTEEIKRDIESTQLRLAEKLTSLENRITDPFQLTGTTLGAAVSSLRTKVKSVADNVRQTVQATNDSIGLRQQVEKRPWLSLGAAALFGYLIAGFSRKRNPPADAVAVAATYSTTRIPAHADESLQRSSDEVTPLLHSRNQMRDHVLWSQVKSIAVRILGRIAEESAYRAVPYLVDSAIGKRRHDEFGKHVQLNDAVPQAIECDQIKLAERIFEGTRQGIPN